MRFQLMCAAALIASGGLANAVRAQNEEAALTEANKPVAKIQLVSELLGTDESAGKGSKAGDKIARKDIFLDLETASVALQVVGWKHTDTSKEIVAVMPFMLTVDAKQTTKLTRGMTENAPSSLNRKLALAVYKEFGRDIYWSKHLENLPADAHGTFDREQFELTGFNTLKGKQITDMDGDRIGKLVDLGIDEDAGTIVYCVIQSEDNSSRAIPLGAFVDRDAKRDWKIELKREQVMLFEPFDIKKPPQTIDRGWQEYVAVRYGRNALQTENKGAINREKVGEQKPNERKPNEDQ